MEYIALFFTHSGAMKYNRYLKKNGVKSELMPVPRKLSSSCGIAAKFCYIEDINEIISDDIEKLYRIDNSDYTVLYEAQA